MCKRYRDWSQCILRQDVELRVEPHVCLYAGGALSYACDHRRLAA